MLHAHGMTVEESVRKILSDISVYFGLSKEFEFNVGMYQGLVLSPFVLAF